MEQGSRCLLGHPEECAEEGFRGGRTHVTCGQFRLKYGYGRDHHNIVSNYPPIKIKLIFKREIKVKPDLEKFFKKKSSLCMLHTTSWESKICGIPNMQKWHQDPGYLPWRKSGHPGPKSLQKRQGRAAQGFESLAFLVFPGLSSCCDLYFPGFSCGRPLARFRRCPLSIYAKKYGNVKKKKVKWLFCTSCMCSYRALI